jgi:hypothetical protein
LQLVAFVRCSKVFIVIRYFGKGNIASGLLTMFGSFEECTLDAPLLGEALVAIQIVCLRVLREELSGI